MTEKIKFDAVHIIILTHLAVKFNTKIPHFLMVKIQGTPSSVWKSFADASKQILWILFLKFSPQIIRFIRPVSRIMGIVDSVGPEDFKIMLPGKFDGFMQWIGTHSQQVRHYIPGVVENTVIKPMFG